jgi:hypothetical protein
VHVVKEEEKEEESSSEDDDYDFSKIKPIPVVIVKRPRSIKKKSKSSKSSKKTSVPKKKVNVPKKRTQSKKQKEWLNFVKEVAKRPEMQGKSRGYVMKQASAIRKKL